MPQLFRNIEIKCNIIKIFRINWISDNLRLFQSMSWHVASFFTIFATIFASFSYYFGFLLVLINSSSTYISASSVKFQIGRVRCPVALLACFQTNITELLTYLLLLTQRSDFTYGFNWLCRFEFR